MIVALEDAKVKLVALRDVVQELHSSLRIDALAMEAEEKARKEAERKGGR